MPKDTDSESTPGSPSSRELRGYLAEMAWAFILINLLVGLVGWLVGRYMGEPRLGIMVFAGGSLVVTTLLGIIVLLNAGIVALVRSIRRWTAPASMDDDEDDGEPASAPPPPPPVAPAPPPPAGPGTGDRGTGDRNGGNPGRDELEAAEDTEDPEPAELAGPVS